MLRKIGRRQQPRNEKEAGIDCESTCATDNDDGVFVKARLDRLPFESVSLLAPSPPLSGSAGKKEFRHALTTVGCSSSGVQSSEGRLQLDRLGISPIHAGPDPLVDVVFVHGIGGTSITSWSWERDPQNFWPAWLGKDEELNRSRIFTFGYNASLSAQSTCLDILDFAKQLLFRMKTYSNSGGMDNQPIGKFPLIFVMHSMGGLVGKKAYIIGKSDQQYASMVSQIQAMVFLGTPHRGSADAEFLNHILRITPGFSSGIYVSELEKTSTTLQDINEQFRTACGDLRLVSLYETQKTHLGLGVKKLIVDRDSAVLGYPTESSSGLDADHHSICKFSGINDPNYIHVRDVLRMFLTRYDVNASRSTVSATSKKDLEKILGVRENPAADFETFRDRRAAGSCHWFLHRSIFATWKDTMDGNSKILWLTGLPAVGKSVLSSFVIESLQRDVSIGTCFYYFFKSGNETKRALDQMMRSIVFQMAQSCPSFRDKLLELYDSSSFSFEQQGVRTMWETIFEGILFRQQFGGPFFWVIDGLDEADDPEFLVKLLSRLRSKNCFRILIVSRPTRETSPSFASSVEIMHDEISLGDTFDDIKAYASSVMSSILCADKSEDDLCAKLLEKAHGSFLWVTLVLDQLKDSWHTQDSIGEVLNDLPEGMEPLYERMMHIVSEQPPKPRAIALRILTWAACAFRPLKLEELEAALSSEFGNFLSLKDTITQTCGNLVMVENSRATLIHDTAREFLLHKTAAIQSATDYCSGNNYIALTCLKYLMDPKKNWKHTLDQLQVSRVYFQACQQGKRGQLLFDAQPFLSYAVTCWAYHVSISPTHSDLIPAVLGFLETSCLVWINAIALLGDLRILTRAAQWIKLYFQRKNRKASKSSLITPEEDRNDELKLWAKDLIRIVGRFGSALSQNPQSIYRHIIPFCPTGSIIGQTHSHLTGLSVTGISSRSWDDCLARLPLGNEEYASQVLCMGMYSVALMKKGTLLVWHAESCGEARRIDHGGRISVMGCGRISSLVATAGTKTIRIWEIASGKEVISLPKLYKRQILAFSFGSEDDKLLIGYSNSWVQCIDLLNSVTKWKLHLAEPESKHLCPHLMSFSPDNYHVVVGYRGKPMQAWNIDLPGQGPQKCIRPGDPYDTQHDKRAITAESVVWRHGLPALFIIYNNATLVEWNIAEDTQRKIPEVRAREMAVSHDGNLLLTSDYNGTLSVWTVPEFQLVYQVQARGIVRSLAFSPDGQRVYDIRGTFCNVWEPDALIRADDLDREELSNTQDTMSSELTLPTSEPERPQITALVHDTASRFYCCGKDSGAVVLHDMRTGEKIRKVYGHSAVASVIEVAWSSSSKYIASADDVGGSSLRGCENETAKRIDGLCTRY